MMSKAQEKHIPDTSVEQDVMRDAIYALTAYCVHQSIAAETEGEKEWWGAKHTALKGLIFDLRNATSEDLEKVARLATQELNALKAARSS